MIARETGKPFWEAQTEVAAVVGKVEISINAYAERTPKRSIEAAVLKAQPLPYAGFEQVFARTLTLNFEARDR